LATNLALFPMTEYTILSSLFWKTHLVLMISWLVVLQTSSRPWLFLLISLYFHRERSNVSMATSMFVFNLINKGYVIIHISKSVFLRDSSFCRSLCWDFSLGCFVSSFYSSVFNAFTEFSKWFFHIYKIKISFD
jgi:hypothetical protein